MTASVRGFLETLDSKPCQPDRSNYPYRRYLPAVAALLLGGRVRATFSGKPNLVDVDRVCKEGNFNVRAFTIYSELLLGLQSLEVRGERYQLGPAAARFFAGALPDLRTLTRTHVGTLVDELTPRRSARPTQAYVARLDVFLRLVCGALTGLGVRSDQFGAALQAFAQLPAGDLLALAHQHGETELRVQHVHRWSQVWLDSVGSDALIGACNVLRWFDVSDDYALPSYAARVMLGLEEPLQPHTPALDLVVQPDLSILAGEDLPLETLVPLLRSCKIQRIDRIISLRLTKKHLLAVPTTPPAAEQILAVLQPLGPLPSTVQHLLGDAPALRGTLAVRPCAGILRVDDPVLIDRIRAIPKLKGYLDQVGLPGYLVVKSGSSLSAFIARCQEFGLTVQPL